MGWHTYEGNSHRVTGSICQPRCAPNFKMTEDEVWDSFDNALESCTLPYDAEPVVFVEGDVSRCREICASMEECFFFYFQAKREANRTSEKGTCSLQRTSKPCVRVQVGNDDINRATWHTYEGPNPNSFKMLCDGAGTWAAVKDGLEGRAAAKKLFSSQCSWDTTTTPSTPPPPEAQPTPGPASPVPAIIGLIAGGVALAAILAGIGIGLKTIQQKKKLEAEQELAEQQKPLADDHVASKAEVDEIFKKQASISNAGQWAGENSDVPT